MCWTSLLIGECHQYREGCVAVQLCGEAVSQEADRQGEGGSWVGVILGSSIWEITVKFLVSRYKVKAGSRDDRVSPCQTSCHIIRRIFLSSIFIAL